MSEDILWRRGKPDGALSRHPTGGWLEGAADQACVPVGLVSHWHGTLAPGRTIVWKGGYEVGSLAVADRFGHGKIGS